MSTASSDSCNFSRIKLRTKAGSPVITDEIDPREIMLSDYEDVVYVKNLDNEMLAFLPNNDDGISVSSTWSSYKVSSWVINYVDDTFDIIDGGTF